jgi:hypothetical protein
MGMDVDLIRILKSQDTLINRFMIVISIGILQINPQVWLDLNSPIRFFSRYRVALEPKSGIPG